MKQNNHPSTHYENFPVASWLCPKDIRPAVIALYRFARTADDLADEGAVSSAQRLEALQNYRDTLQRFCTMQNSQPDCPWLHVMHPLQETITRYKLPLQPLHDLISAFERDVRHTASGYVYPDWNALADYARLSANPVGRLMLHLYGIADTASLEQSDAICTALQYYNFWQDISVDISRQRYYLPLAACAPLGIDPRHPQKSSTEQQSVLIKNLLQHTNTLMQKGAPLPHTLARQPRQGSRFAAIELQLVMQGGTRIGEKVHHLGTTAIHQRPTLHIGDWLLILTRALTTQFRSQK